MTQTRDDFLGLRGCTHYVPAKNSEYDQEIPQSQISDNPVAPQGRAVTKKNDLYVI